MVVGNVPTAVDLVVVGGGPGGYAAALHAAHLGRQVLLVDAEGDEGLGGVCLRVGCIPSKAMIEAADLHHRIPHAKAMGVRAQRGAFDMAHTVLGPLLCGQQVHSGANISELFQQIKGHQFAKSAFDCAWWDAFSKYKKQPLWKLIGGVNQTVSVGADFPVQSTAAELLTKVDRAVADGFQRIKIKFNPQSNVATIAEIRSKYPDMLIHVDCNSGFSLDDIELFKELDELGLAMIEQPLAYDDLIFHAELQSKIKTPICLDESITSIERTRKAIDIDACRYINIKTSRVGGLSNAIEIHNLCQDRGIPIWVGGMLESAVGQSFSLALATMPNVGYPNDIFPSRRFYEVDMSTPEIVLSSPGMIEAPRSFGAGFAPDFNKLLSASVKSASICV